MRSAPSIRELEHALHEGGSLVALSRWPRTLLASDQSSYAFSAFVARAMLSANAKPPVRIPCSLHSGGKRVVGQLPNDPSSERLVVSFQWVVHSDRPRRLELPSLSIPGRVRMNI